MKTLIYIAIFLLAVFLLSGCSSYSKHGYHKDSLTKKRRNTHLLDETTGIHWYPFIPKDGKSTHCATH